MKTILRAALNKQNLNLSKYCIKLFKCRWRKNRHRCQNGEKVRTKPEPETIALFGGVFELVDKIQILGRSWKKTGNAFEIFLAVVCRNYTQFFCNSIDDPGRKRRRLKHTHKPKIGPITFENMPHRLWNYINRIVICCSGSNTWAMRTTHSPVIMILAAFPAIEIELTKMLRK